MVRSPVEICLGTSPSQAAKSRPFVNASPVPIAATIALEMIGPIPGPLIKPAPVAGQVLEHPRHAQRQDIAGRGENAWQLSAQEAQALPHGNATLQQEAVDLIDDAGALTDQPLTHAVESLQVELLGGLGCDELHRRALHRLGDCLGIAEVVLLPPRVGAHIFGWHQPSVVAKRCEFTAQVMCTDASLHPDQTWRQVGEPSFYLAARPLLA